MAWLRSWQGLLAIAALAFLAFLERAFLDWRFVFGEFISEADIGTAAAALAFYVLIAGIWLWVLLAAARGSRRGLLTLLGLALAMLVGGGISTLASFCPSPCRTAWPLMEVSNWAGLTVGILAVLAAGRRLLAGDRSPSNSPEEGR